MWKLILMAAMVAAPVQAALVPAGFVVPEYFEHALFRLEPLTQEYAQADFDAVVASRDALRLLFGGDWPGDDFSLAENQRDIAEHEAQSAAREAFTYTILEPTGGRVVGCVYIVPAETREYEAAVLYWIRTGEQDLEPAFSDALAKWLNNAWPFERIQYLN